MRYLVFELSHDTAGVGTLEALASTAAGQHAEVMAEVEQVLSWARDRFPHGHGPLDEGHDWDHDLQVQVEPGGWHAVNLTLTGTERFVDAFAAAFPLGHDDEG